MATFSDTMDFMLSRSDPQLSSSKLIVVQRAEDCIHDYEGAAGTYSVYIHSATHKEYDSLLLLFLLL